MVRKSALITIFAISLLGCDDDFKQGNCDEGFYEQNIGTDGTYCVPITDTGVADNTMIDVENLDETE